MEDAREQGLEVPAYWEAGAFPTAPYAPLGWCSEFHFDNYCLFVSCRDLPGQLSLTSGQCMGSSPGWLAMDHAWCSELPNLLQLLRGFF